MNMSHTAVICLAMFVLALPLGASEIASRTIEYTHAGDTLEGYFAWDESIDGDRPGVLVVHEWWGHNEFAREKARELAEMGYAAFALDMYGKGVLTDDPAEAQQLAGRFYENDHERMRERALAGLSVLRAQPEVDTSRIAAIGFCFGGTTALQLAYSGAQLRGVVSFHGSLPAPRENDRIGSSILVLHGADDPLVPKNQITSFKEAMEAHEADWQMIYYGGAVHSFTNPAADEYDIDGVAYDAIAHRRSWQAMQSFFEERFGNGRAIDR